MIDDIELIAGKQRGDLDQRGKKRGRKQGFHCVFLGRWWKPRSALVLAAV